MNPRPDYTSHYWGSIWRQSGLAAAEGGVILVIGCVPSHLGHRAAGAPERLAAILAPAAALLGDAILWVDAAARPCHNNYSEDGERDVQAQICVRQNHPDILVTLPHEWEFRDIEDKEDTPVNGGDY